MAGRGHGRVSFEREEERPLRVGRCSGKVAQTTTSAVNVNAGFMRVLHSTTLLFPVPVPWPTVLVLGMCV